MLENFLSKIKILCSFFIIFMKSILENTNLCDEKLSSERDSFNI